MGTVALTYVVPAHNSASAIEPTLRALAGRLAGRDAEVVVVENGSTDGTGDLLERLAAGWDHPGVSLRVLRSAKGMGNAYRAGIAASRGERVVLTADDLPFGFDDLDAADGVDPTVHPVVVGSKGHRDSDVDRGLLRHVLTRGFRLLRRLVLGMRTLDPQGTFVLAGDWARAVGPRLTEPGYLVTTELCFLAERSGVQPLEVPVRLAPAHRGHGSRVTARDVWQMGAGLAGIRRRHGAAVAGGVRGAAAQR
ncbi:Glycosyltransferase involved in cell wall bisynthesis [Geodermatophilus pulveris]|uniref:Glycosyltransferase involved in cell wall bisynthesis n=1 Tax=Geodermatophilus pulveris TaxID=1564159 RepID=A0A239B2Q2_9ACTN|nr:glycosyltransferase [Geodermatophilus pulveris]SNS01852.1 Glycosyltransferase involved in cell wall bisynthesis [Geodermatophilus pulveris]